MDWPSGKLSFLVLGPLAAVDVRGNHLELGPPRQRAVLAILAISANEVVSSDRLIDQLWPEPPPSASGTLQSYVSKLRAVLGAADPDRSGTEIIVTQARGYVLRAQGSQLDSSVFEQLVNDARQHASRGGHEAALSCLHDALGLWRGAALADFEHDDFASVWRTRLDELRAAAEELHVESLRRLGRVAEAIAELERLIAAFPLREGFRTQQVLCLAAVGRQADALRAYDRAREYLAEEMGLDPGFELADAYQRVLRQDPSLRPAAIHPSGSSTKSQAQEVGAQHSVLAPSQVSIVGRDHELDRVRRAPRPTFVAITGERGIGTSSLARAIADDRASRGGIRAGSRCSVEASELRLWPFRSMEPQLGLGLGLDALSDDGRVDAIEFDRTRLRLEQLAGEHPVTIVIDDIHHADDATIRLTSFLASHTHRGDLVVVVTARDARPPRSTCSDLVNTIRSSGGMHLALKGLDHEAMSVLIGDPVDPASAEGWSRRSSDFVDFTGGNPELALALAPWWSSNRDADLPEPIAQMISDAIDRLGTPTTQHLLAAAVLGPSFDLDTLCTLIGEDIDSVAESLQPAIDLRWIVSEGVGRFRFAKGISRRVLLDRAGPLRVGKLHAKAADAIVELCTHGASDRSAEVAEHLHQAAERLGPSLSHRAVQAARRAAASALNDGNPLIAATWLDRAIDHGRRSGMSRSEEVELLTQLCIAQSGTARAGAVDAHHRAIGLARTLPPPERARALTLAATTPLRTIRTWQWRRPGHRDEIVIDALRTALREIDADDHVSRAALLASLAVELLATEDGPTESDSVSADALAAARLTDDSELLVVTMLARILVLDVPGRRSDQLKLTEQVLGVPTIDPALRACALTWRIAMQVSMVEGPPGYDHISLELRALVDHLPDLVTRLNRMWADTVLAQLRCAFDVAAQRARRVFDEQYALGDWEAPSLFALHEMARRRETCTLPDHPEQLVPYSMSASELATLDGLRVWWSGVTNDAVTARELVDHHAERVLRWRGASWMFWMAYLIEAAAICESPWLPRLYEALRPFAGEVILRWPYPIIGAVDHYLGLAARAMGDPGRARGHFLDAVAMHNVIAARSLAMRSQVEAVCAIAEFDRDAALVEADGLAVDLDQLGLVDLARRIEQVRSS